VTLAELAVALWLLLTYGPLVMGVFVILALLVEVTALPHLEARDYQREHPAEREPVA